uniref:Uncharacterized protein n=1 Tax=Micrurus surinamensis TaxID=129470 RepID=A0A2D4PAW6_MICSU
MRNQIGWLSEALAAPERQAGLTRPELPGPPQLHSEASWPLRPATRHGEEGLSCFSTERIIFGQNGIILIWIGILHPQWQKQTPGGYFYRVISVKLITILEDRPAFGGKELLE